MHRDDRALITFHVPAPLPCVHTHKQQLTTMKRTCILLQNLLCCVAAAMCTKTLNSSVVCFTAAAAVVLPALLFVNVPERGGNTRWDLCADDNSSMTVHGYNGIEHTAAVTRRKYDDSERPNYSTAAVHFPRYTV